jgi:RNA polymerase sigma factor (TIGR02999 family)
VSAQDVTQLLRRWREGDTQALEELTPIVDRELRRLAAHYLRKERSGHTLQPTAVVNEVYLCLIDHPPEIDWQSRTQFMGIASKLMRQVLVSHARTRDAIKRGGGEYKLSLEAVFEMANPEPEEVNLLDLEDALEKLAAEAPELSRIVELRYFGGLRIEETAKIMEISPATVKRKWNIARAWLQEALSEEAG